MSPKFSTSIFTQGPFASASANAEMIASNLYFSLLLQDSLKAQMQMEKDYEILLRDDDTSEKDIENKRKQIDYADNLLGFNILYSQDEGPDS
tara:strand:+ start:415 stop:690 length:276 start_codon:yes stop_codon:yes gene_type:complete